MRMDIRGIIVPNDDKFAYDFYELESTCPNDVVQQAQRAKDEPLEVYINSGGGDLIAGLDIYSQLKRHPGDVHIHVIYAASAAGVIACAGKSDIIAPGLFMVHNVSGGFSGDYHEMDKGSEILRKANEAVAAAYVEKSGMGQEEALALMDRETWLTAGEAVRYGLIDVIADDTPRLAAAGQCMLPRTVIRQLKQTAKHPLSAQAARADFLCAKAELEFLTLKGEK